MFLKSRSKRGANDKIKRIHLSLRFRLENSYKHEFGPLMNATARGYYNAAEILTISRKRRVVCQTIFLSNTRGLNPSSWLFNLTVNTLRFFFFWNGIITVFKLHNQLICEFHFIHFGQIWTRYFIWNLIKIIIKN